MTTLKPIKKVSSVTVCFAGDSGDGMQLTGSQFADATALMGNDLTTLTDFPAEIRAPLGSLPGVSSFQIQFSDNIIFTAGDQADVLIAMNPAALKVSLPKVKKGALIVINEDVFAEANLKKANWDENPLTSGALSDYQLIKVPLTSLTKNALQGIELKTLEIERSKNFFALGIAFWIYSRKYDSTIEWIQNKFAQRPNIVEGNVKALKAGYDYADITESLPCRYEVLPADIEPGTYRRISGNEAAAIGLCAAALLSKKKLIYASYPITPASEILHELVRSQKYGVRTFQAEDEIAACGAALGAAFAGQLGVTGTSGPGMCLKSEMMGLAVMAELPVVIINVQRGGPSTGMPTKTEQSDLLQALYGRHGESPMPVLAARTPADCFTMAVEAVRIATKYVVPVILLSDSYLANGVEPWRLPDLSQLPEIKIEHPSRGKGKFMPYARNSKTLARPWAVPGSPGLENCIGGLGKAHQTGKVSYDPANNRNMTRLRAEKVLRIQEDIPDLEVRGPAKGKLLVMGWGSSYGAIYDALSHLEKEGIHVSQAHLNYLNPFPKNLDKILKSFEKILICELNLGQLLCLIRNHYSSVNATGFHKVEGYPFSVAEVVNAIREAL